MTNLPETHDGQSVGATGAGTTSRADGDAVLPVHPAIGLPPEPQPRFHRPSSTELLEMMTSTNEASIEAAAAEAMSGISDRDLASAMAAAPTEQDSPPAGESTGEANIVMTGRIANIGSKDVLIDFGSRSLGAMSLTEFEKNETYAIGDTIEVAIVGDDAKLGLLTCSRRKARQIAVLRELKIGSVLEGVVTGMNKGGLEVDVAGLRGFIPASQVDVHFVKDISDLIGQRIHAEVIKFETGEGDIVLSRRNWQLKEAEERKARLLAELEVGQIRRGKVRALSEFGAFVDLGGVDALLHISDMSWGRVARPEDVVKVGDEIEAKIIKINRQKGRVSLSLKQTLADPWQSVEQRYSVGMKLKGRVVRLQNFGAFVELEPGVDGLVPTSEISWTRRIRNPAEAVKEGDVVDVAVIAVEAAKRRISLSMKQATPDPWSLVAEKYHAGAKVRGVVARTTDFGAFVALEDGIDGLIHISELSDQRVRAVTDKVKPGDEVEVRVLGVDPENRKISLSMKPPPREPTPEELAQIEREREHARKKREKQASRRGGLTISWDQGLGSLDPSKFAR